MAKTLRVHHLAKELGVPSKVIIAKCNAEGVEPPLKNHMAAVSIGLAESIREWFSAGADVTTIEVASPVDLDRVKTKQAEAEAASDSSTGEGGVATQTLEAEEVKTEQVEEVAEVAAESPEPAEEAATPQAEEVEEEVIEQGAESVAATDQTAAPVSITTEAAEPVAEEQQVAEEGVEEAEQTAVVDAPQELAAKADDGEVEPPAEPETPPEPIMPAGPKLVPKPAELKGPRVVRIEAPEPVRAPRPRHTGPRPGPTPPSIPGMPDEGGARKKGGARKPGTDQNYSRSRSPRRRSGADLSSERLREWRDQDLIERKERLASATGHGVRARRSAERTRRSGGPHTPAGPKSEVAITVPILIKDFCAAVGAPFPVIFQKLIEHTGKAHRITDTLGAEAVELVAMDLGITLNLKHDLTAVEQLQQEFQNRERNDLQPRPPVVAMLGHVDHGKTSLLDAIRKTDVVAGESGGITQHIGAYQVRRDGWNVTFLDTPGHEAFTAMRARGANMTDVVVLVIAADDGVMPQTVEAINHAKAAGVQIVIALNKIDLPGVDLNRVYSQLAEQELAPTEWGGDTDVVKTSATKGEGVDELLAHLSTLSELLDLKADPTVPATGAVIEAQMRGGRGVVAQILVQEGTLKVGQTVVCGPGAGRVRSLLDHRGKRIKEAGPGTPVEVVGLDELPQAGDKLYVVDSLAMAKSAAEEVRHGRRQEELREVQKPKTLEELLAGSSEDEIPELNVILRADVQGSVDTLRSTLAEFPRDRARLRILHSGVGAITEADVELARASEAIMVGFHVVADDRARQLAERYGLEIRVYRVIYDITDDLHKALEGLLEPEHREESRGRVEVRQVFNVSKVGRIAGCYVVDGVIARNHKVRLLRDGRIVCEGHGIGSLKRFKDDAREVRTGFECGVKIEGYDDLKPGDIIEAYELIEVAPQL